MAQVIFNLNTNNISVQMGGCGILEQMPGTLVTQFLRWL